MGENRKDQKFIFLEEILGLEGDTYYCLKDYEIGDEKVNLIFQKGYHEKDVFENDREALLENSIDLVPEIVVEKISNEIYSKIGREYFSGRKSDYFFVRDQINISLFSVEDSGHNTFRTETVKKYRATAEGLSAVDPDFIKNMKEKEKELQAALSNLVK
jgi:hypothetical protein